MRLQFYDLQMRLRHWHPQLPFVRLIQVVNNHRSVRRWTTSPRGRRGWWLKLIWVEKVWDKPYFRMVFLSCTGTVLELQPLWRCLKSFSGLGQEAKTRQYLGSQIFAEMSSWVSNLLFRRIVWLKCNSVTGSCCCGVFFQVEVQLMNYIAPNSPKCYPTKKTPISHWNIYIHLFTDMNPPLWNWKLIEDFEVQTLTKPTTEVIEVFVADRGVRSFYPCNQATEVLSHGERCGSEQPSSYGEGTQHPRLMEHFSSWSAVRIYPSVWKTKVTIEALSAMTQRLQSQKPNQQLTLFLGERFWCLVSCLPSSNLWMANLNSP